MPDIIPSLFLEQAKLLPKKVLFWHKHHGKYQPISWEEASEIIRSVSAYLIESGIRKGDRVAILSESRAEWGMADIAIQCCGALTVPIYPSLTTSDILAIANDCKPVLFFASNAEQASKIKNILGQLPSVSLIVVMDSASSEGEIEKSWQEVIALGKELLPKLSSETENRVSQISSEDPATIIYTSGTTGEPKGVVLTHRNFLSNASSCLKVIPISASDIYLSFLPLSHVFERMAGWYLMLMAGASVAYTEKMDTTAQDMLQIRPTVMLGVPRFFEKLYDKVQEGIQNASPIKKSLAKWAFQTGKEACAYFLSRNKTPLLLSIKYFLADILVFHKLKRKLGGRMRFFVSGSAPLSKTMGEFFYSTGIIILEGYGLTETSPVIAVNRLGSIKFGTVGKTVEGAEVKIAQDGEILTRGPHVMQGYYNKPQETKEAIDSDGWFHTGDIGHLDDEGYLIITDRKKDLIKTAGGKFVAPQKLESMFVADPYISQALVFGDLKRYCVCLIVPSEAKLTEYAKSNRINYPSYSELVRLPEIHDFIWSRIQDIQKNLASFEQVKAIALLDHEFSQASGELTPTLKAKRKSIEKNYYSILENLYQQNSAN